MASVDNTTVSLPHRVWRPRERPPKCALRVPFVPFFGHTATFPPYTRLQRAHYPCIPTARYSIHDAANHPPRTKHPTTRKADLRKPRNTAIPQHRAVERLPRRGRITARWRVYRTIRLPPRGKHSTAHETPHRAESRFTETMEYGQFAVLRGGTFTAPWKISHAVEGLPRGGGFIARSDSHHAANIPPRTKHPTARKADLRKPWNTANLQYYAVERLPRHGRSATPWKDYRAVEGLPRDGGATRHKTRPRGTVGKITVPRPCRLDVIWVSLLQLIGLDQPRAQGAPAVYEQRSLV